MNNGVAWPFNPLPRPVGTEKRCLSVTPKDDGDVGGDANGLLRLPLPSMGTISAAAAAAAVFKPPTAGIPPAALASATARETARSRRHFTEPATICRRDHARSIKSIAAATSGAVMDPSGVAATHRCCSSLPKSCGPRDSDDFEKSPWGENVEGGDDREIRRTPRVSAIDDGDVGKSLGDCRGGCPGAFRTTREWSCCSRTATPRSAMA